MTDQLASNSAAIPQTPAAEAPSFLQFNLASSISKALTESGYTSPTPIQAQVIPLAMEGRDVLGIAQTGTGKTAAFVLPILQKIAAARSQRGQDGSPLKAVGQQRKSKTAFALILAPTRELAGQILDSAQTLGKHLRIKSGLVVGGARPGPQIRALHEGLDLLVATPGRLLDHLQQGHADLSQTQIAVLDEADQMMDLGFMPAIKTLLAKLPANRQTLLLSATMPREIRQLADSFLTNPAEVAVAAVSRPIERITQSLVLVDPGQKSKALLELLDDDDIDQAIVFTRTKHGADRVQQAIKDAGHFTQALHGNKTQGQRDRTLAAFREGRVKVLVATDIAARGIDVDGISHVFNYDLPNIPEAYVHRIGRTGRAGRSGVAVSLCEPSEHGLARQIERLTGSKLLPDHLRDSARPSSKGKPRSFRPKPSGSQGYGAGAGQGAGRPRAPGSSFKPQGAHDAPRDFSARPKPAGGPVNAPRSGPRPDNRRPHTAGAAPRQAAGRRPYHESST